MKYSKFRKQKREWEDRCEVNQYNKKSIWAFVNKYYMPEHPHEMFLCRIGLHKYRGYNCMQYTAGIAYQFNGRCVRCGKRKVGPWVG